MPLIPRGTGPHVHTPTHLSTYSKYNTIRGWDWGEGSVGKLLAVPWGPGSGSPHPHKKLGSWCTPAILAMGRERYVTLWSSLASLVELVTFRFGDSLSQNLKNQVGGTVIEKDI